MLIGIATFSGCVHASYETTRAVTDPVIELHACTFVSSRPDAQDRQTRRNLQAIQKQFKETKPQTAPFRSYDEIESLEDSRGIQAVGCDIAVEIGAVGRKLKIWTYSAQTKEPLFDSLLSGMVWVEWGTTVRKSVYDEFRKDPKLANNLLAAAGRTRALASTGAPVSPAPPKIASDVDVPGYSLKERSEDFAVVIGIEGYKDLPDARFAERDAETVRDHLIALGFPKRHIVLLKGKDATRTGFQKYLEEWLPRNVNPASDVFFYYSGHGAPDPASGKAFLVPWDGDASFLKSTAYSVDQLLASLHGLKATQVVVALDACFSGGGGRSVLAKGARPLVMKVDAVAVPQGMAMFAAASSDQITSTLEDKGHGTFTYYFIKGLSGGAKDAAGRVMAGVLYDYLKPRVQDEARLQNREQEPTLQGQADQELVRF
ncbi:MAG: caspase family protein [Elusimicrobia bacterium]|nr:caspase family protein [Elusimicrobiota bacterium]